MAKRKQPASSKRARRTITDEFKQEAVQMLLDGHAASSISENLGIGNTNFIYRWKAELLSEFKSHAIEPRKRNLRRSFRFLFSGSSTSDAGLASIVVRRGAKNRSR